MKRQQMIQRLVEGMGHNPKELDNLSNANIRAIYEECRPVMAKKRERMAGIIQRQQKAEIRKKKLIVRIQEDISNRKLQAEWVAIQSAKARRNMVLYGQPFEPINDHAMLNFGLASLVAYAKVVHREHGDQDAAATLRMFSNSVPMHTNAHIAYIPMRHKIGTGKPYSSHKPKGKVRRRNGIRSI